MALFTNDLNDLNHVILYFCLLIVCMSGVRLRWLCHSIGISLSLTTRLYFRLAYTGMNIS